jgi:hypothetical protein
VEKKAQQNHAIVFGEVFGLALNLDLPDLCLLSSWDYWCESLVPSLTYTFITDF